MRSIPGIAAAIACLAAVAIPACNSPASQATIYNYSAPFEISERPTDADHLQRHLWLSDFESLKTQLEAGYPNLLWKASPESDVDLPRLATETERRLLSARTYDDAFDAIEQFVYGINDGHLYLMPPGSLHDAPPPAMLREVHGDAPSACAALGYADFEGGAYSLPFERAGKFSLISRPPRSAFRTGIITLAGGRKIAIVRIKSFMSDNLAAGCEAVFEQLSTPAGAAAWPRWCGPTCERELREEAVRISIDRLQTDIEEAARMGAEALLLDLGGNQGGEIWAWRLAELFAGAPLEKPVIGIVADGRLDRQLSLTDKFGDGKSTNESGAPPSAEHIDARRSLLESVIASYDRPLCDFSWVWREQRPWSKERAFACTTAVVPPFDGFGSPREFESSRYKHGAKFWRGPLAVYIDRNSASAAELFAGVLQDANAALIIGERSFGAGCGFVDFESPIVLPFSGIRIIAPDCVLLRKDGTNSVAGVTPHVNIRAVPGETSAILAGRVIEAAASQRIFAEFGMKGGQSSSNGREHTRTAN